MSLAARAAALSGAVAVAAGAFGAHGASSSTAADWLRTGAVYQMVHAVAALVALGGRRPAGGARVAAWLLLGGSALFAGSLYAMALGGPRWLGAVAPAGGLGMIAGWIMLALRRA